MEKFTTPSLPYEYNALEPYMDEETIKVHHDKHHVAYTTNFNKALENNPELFDKTAEAILQDIDSVPEEIKTAIKNHGGGHVHHSILWETIRPGKENNLPEGELLEAINDTFESFDNFKEELTKASMTVFGSGWAWLSLDNGKLIIEKTLNQDSPYSLNHTPLFGIDVWEHAYYLKYQNRRNKFIENFFKIINWDKVQEKYLNNK